MRFIVFIVLQSPTDLVAIKALEVDEDLSVSKCIRWEPVNLTLHDIPFDKEDIDYVRNALQGIKLKHGCYALALIVQSSLKLFATMELIQGNNVTLKNLPEGAYFEVLKSPDKAKLFLIPRGKH